MYDPSMRVLAVLELLQTHERQTGSELAAQLEVSVRTVQRYVARLQDLGVPVEGTRGPGGTYRLRPGFRMPPLMFGTEEAFALALGLAALSHLGINEIAPASASARAKLERVLPETVSERVRLVRDTLVLEPPRWLADADVDALMTLARATHVQQRVNLEYVSSEATVSQRSVEPYGLMQHEGRWFLAANCLLRRDLRLFRVDRIRKVTAHPETFTPPEDFDLREFLYASIAFAPAPWQIELWLDLPPAEVEARLPRALAVLEPEGTGTRLRRGGTDLEWFAAIVLQLGCRVSVREPAALRDAFRRLADRSLEIASG